MLADMLHRFGSVLPSHHMISILNTLIPKFRSSRQAVRKRAIILCSVLACYCDSLLYKQITDHLFNGLAMKVSASESNTYVQCVSAVCCQSGRRFGEQIERFLPLISQCSQEDDDDTREYCLQALQAFVQKCPKEITPFIPMIMEICLQYLAYDPNYNYEAEEEDEDQDCMNVSRETDDESDHYSDDDDVTWRVRRASIKCLESVISSRYELLPEFYRNLAPALIARFKERDENVKSDIFQAVISLLKQTKPTMVDRTYATSEEDPRFLLQQQVSSIVNGVCCQMKEKSIKTRQACFRLLKVLCIILPGALDLHVGDVIPGIRFSLTGSNSSSSMEIDALSFMYSLLTSHSPEVFYSHINAFLPPVIGAVKSDFYKTSAEGLVVLRELVKVMRPLDTVSGFDYTSFVSEIYSCTLGRMKASDMEVKEQAILTMGQIVSNFGDYLQEELPICMPIFLDRLKNEITRLTTIKALTNIAQSVLFVDLHITNEVIPILGSFLRQNQRILKLSTLQLLDRLVKIYYNHIKVELLNDVIMELPVLLDESDLLLAQWTLVLLETITRYHPTALEANSAGIFSRIMRLMKSPFLQGTVLVSMLHFLRSMVKCNIPGLEYNEVLQLISKPSFEIFGESVELQKTVYYSMAKCVAAVTTVCKNQVQTVTNSFLKIVKSPGCDSQHIFCLLVIGEIGREVDLFYIEDLKDVILDSFSATSEDIKFAASYALGSVSIGNLEANLPFILKKMKEQHEQYYLLLSSLREIITCMISSPDGITQLLPFISEIWEQLLPHCQSPEEGVRNVVAECLGKSTLIDPAKLLQELQKHLTHHDPLIRATIVTAVKFIITDKPHDIDPLLYQCIRVFLDKLQDPDVTVRRATLLVFNSAAHNKPALIRDLLDVVLPHLYNATIVNTELIQEVEMGPFKHIVDDGLDIRKAAFECMYTLLNRCIDKIDIYEFLNHVEGGLVDHYDIKMLTYLMVGRLAQLRPIAVLQEMDKLIEPLQVTCIDKIKVNSVQQEHKRQEELKRSAIRAIVALFTIPEADKNTSLREVVTQIRDSPDLASIFEMYLIQKDSAGLNPNEILTRN